MLWILQVLIHVAAARSHSLLDAHLTKCVLHLSDSYIEKGFLITSSLFSNDNSVRTLRIWNSSQGDDDFSVEISDVLKNLHLRKRWQILTLTHLEEEQKYYQTLHDIHYKSTGYIIWLSKETGFISNQLEILRSYKNTWNFRARFLCVFDDIMPNPRRTAEDILKEVEHIKVFNVLVLIPSKQGLRTLDVYTWFPYEPSSGKCGKFRKSVMLDQWLMEGKGRFLRNVFLFPSKIPRTFDGCEITAALVPQKPFVMSWDREERKQNITVYNEGTDIRVFLFVAEVMNMSVTFTPPLNLREIWPIKLDNGSWTGVLGQVFNNDADIAFSGLSINLDRYIHFDITSAYYFSGLLWVVPCAEPFERWNSITRVFSASVWLLIFITIIMSAGCMYFLSSCRIKYIAVVDPYKTISSCFYNVWAIFLGTSVPEMPRTDHLKIFFIMLVWYCLAVTTVFQAFVTSYLIDPGFHKQISSLEDLIASGIEYGYYPGIDVLLPNTSDWQTKEILSHRKACYGEKCVERAIVQRDFATLSDTLYTEYMKAYAAYDSNGRSVVCSFKQESKIRLVAMYLQKGSFLTENINRMINIAIEAGLNNFWWKRILDTLRNKVASDGRHTMMDDYTVLLLVHLQAAFYLLEIGYCFAFLTFIGEILYSKGKGTHCMTKMKHRGDRV